jgi:hypothetical protein
LSHVVTITTEVRDRAAIQAACKRLGLAEPVHGTARLFSGPVEGWAVLLAGWQYPIVCDTNNGQIKFDNFGGRWGDPKHLDAFLQAYACEKVRIESRKQGHQVREQQLADGSIKLVIQVQGGVA